MNHLSEPQLNLFLDGGLGPAERAEAARHLETCAGCRAQLDDLRSVFSMLEGLADRRLDRDLSQAVLAGLAAREPSPLGWRLALAAQAGVALGVLVTVSQAATVALASGSYWEALWRQSIQASARIIAISGSFTLPAISVPAISLPSFSLPRFALPWNAAEIGIVAAAAAVLWIVGNASLLSNRPGR